MPPKKGKKGKKQDDGWGDDKGVEEKMKNLMVADDSDNEAKPTKKGKSLTPVTNDSSAERSCTCYKCPGPASRCHEFLN